MTDGQADAGARVLGAGVEALEDLEDALGVLRLNANAVVLDGKQPLTLAVPGGDMDARRVLAPELDGIGDEVLENQHELRHIGPH